jgi:hypothetical protein
LILDDIFQPANGQAFMLEPNKHVLEVVSDVDLIDLVLA